MIMDKATPSIGDKIQADIIRELALIGGIELAQGLNGLKQGEVFFPRFSYRSTYDKYFEEKHSEIEKARAEVERLLLLPDPDPLPPETDRELQRILKAADKACAESAA